MPINRIESGVPPSKSTHLIKQYTLSAVLGASATEHTYITPPPGKLWQIINMRLIASNPVGATSGNHVYTLRVGQINILAGDSNFGSMLKWDYTHWESADKSQKPNTDIAAQTALISTHIVKITPLEIIYSNFTDAAQGSMRHIYFSILETPII